MLQDYGSMWTRDGEVSLVKDKRLFMWRDDVQQLVQEGALFRSSRRLNACTVADASSPRSPSLDS